MEAVYTDEFERAVRKIKDASVKERVKAHIKKILEKPDIGKPLKFQRKGEWSVRIPPFRIIYSIQGNRIYFLDFDKRDRVYS